MTAVRNNLAASRFEMYQDGTLAGFVQYTMHGSQIWMHYTQMAWHVEDPSISGVLIANAMLEAYRRRLAVMPFCPAVRRYVATHPLFVELIPAEHRERFAEEGPVRMTRVEALAEEELAPGRTVPLMLPGEDGVLWEPQPGRRRGRKARLRRAAAAAAAAAASVPAQRAS
ncbi:MAG: hypothetical protein JWO93_942 [Micrococcaceae bacterium]|jgi:predicted GNAT family acetyltransferase|nr:hypothetical protein [Micrococcaceae bacterium]